ncbi:MAG: 16S rRNA (guanine(527)-N(7))-methyltransferase RsmG [Luminiphilus sp.]|nr:16S rRNA (guanine(527)-N(7))-methyltransferase RsmG [Luminiphilus sp.]
MRDFQYDLICKGLAALSIDEKRAVQLYEYLQLLQKWNKPFNLTAIKKAEEMIPKHLMDSLSILTHLGGARRICDVGTGAGLPGIPLAVCCPETEFVLLDSNGKKTRFLHQVRRHLNLDNVTIVEGRAEDYQPDIGFDAVLSRAFADLMRMCQVTQHLLKKNGVWLAMKSQILETEQATLDARVVLVEQRALQVPSLNEVRQLAVLKFAEATT